MSRFESVLSGWDYVGMPCETAKQRGRIDEAAQRFGEYQRLAARMIKAEPDNLRSLYNYGACQYRLGNLEKEKYVF